MNPKPLKVISRKLNVSLGENNWNLANSFDFDPTIDKKRGSLFLLIGATTGASGVELVSIQRSLVKIVYEQYYKNTTLTAFNALTNAIKIAEKEALKTSINVSIGATVCLNDVIYVSAVNASVSIFRIGSLSKIISNPDSVVSASGYPRKDDVLIMATNAFTKTCSESLVRDTFFANTDSDVFLLHNAVDQLEKHIGKSDLNIGACFLKFEEGAELDQKDQDNVFKFDELDNEISEVSSIPNSLNKVDNQEPYGGNIISKGSSFASQLSPKLFLNFKNRVSKDKIVSIEDRSGEYGVAQKRKKLTMLVGIVLIVLLLVSILFGVMQKNKKDAISAYEPRLNAAQHDFDEALSLFSLSPERAREHFFSSQNLVDQLIAEEIKDEKLINLSSELKTNRGKILGEYLQDLQGFIDLTLLSDGFHGDDLAVSGEKVYVLDRNGRKLISIDIGTKRSEVLAGPGAIDTGPYFTASSADRAYVSTTDGIYRVDDGRQLSVEDNFTFAHLPYSYAANLYIVDTLESKIMRYSAFEGGFTQGGSWLVDSAQPDLSKIKSLAIDGSIWMVSETGGVFKFSLGNQVNFRLSGVFPEIISPTQIFTTDELEYLYILEPSQSRVVVITKEGVFAAQYISDKLTGAIDFGVSEIEKKLIFLTGSKLESMDLSHF